MTTYEYADYPAQPEERKRPFGIYAIIVLQMLNILANFFNFVRFQFGVSTQVLPNLEDARWIGLINIAIAIALVLVIVGLWRYQKWAWFAVMILSGIALIFGIWQYFHDGQPYVNLLINSLVVFYLNQGNVRAVFEDQPLYRKPLEAAS